MNILDKINYINECMQNGKALLDAKVWADRATRIGTLQHFLTALIGLGAAFGYTFNVSPTDISSLAVGISVLVGILSQISNVIHVASNPEAGEDTSRSLIKPNVWPKLIFWTFLDVTVIAAAGYYISVQL